MSQAPFFLSVTQFTEPNKFKPDSLIEKISHSKSDKSKAESCKNLYKSMQTNAKKKKNSSSKFPKWFKNVPNPKDYSWDEFLDCLIKQGVPSRNSAWNNSHLNKLKEILKSVKEIRTYDFDSDELNRKGKQYQKKSLDKWEMMENSAFYKNILNIKSLTTDFNATQLPEKWQHSGKINNVAFREAALIILPSLASYVQEEIKRIEKKKNKIKSETGIDVSNPEKFSKSKKMRLVSLLITYLLHENVCNSKVAKLHSAGRHAIFVESERDGKPVHFKFTDLGGKDYIDISELKRTPAEQNEPQINKKMKIGEKLSRIKNMAMYRSAIKSSDDKAARAAMAEVEFKDQTKIDSAYKLLLVAWDVCVFFHYLHSNEVRRVHCDIKRANICVTKDATYVQN